MNAITVLGQKRFSADKMCKANLVETDHLFCDLYCLLPGQGQKAHTHDTADKIYYVLEGKATVMIGGEDQTLDAGQLVLAPAGTPHGVRNDSQSELALLVMMAPNPNRSAEKRATSHRESS